ncbi:unnamed protein product, partial [Strongylus vulgaris]
GQQLVEPYNLEIEKKEVNSPATRCQPADNDEDRDERMVVRWPEGAISPSHHSFISLYPPVVEVIITWVTATMKRSNGGMYI